MFWFELALAMGRTVRELLAAMDARELAEWCAYWDVRYSPEVIGPKRKTPQEMDAIFRQFANANNAAAGHRRA
jgi:hypothetical protein